MNLRNRLALHVFMLSCVLIYMSVQFYSVRGNSSDIEDYSHLVAIYYKKKYHCVGSLVSTSLVVTSATCATYLEVKRVVVVAGITNLNETGQRRTARSAFYSPYYIYYTNFMNIGVIIMRKPFTTGPNIKPIELCNIELTSGTTMQVNGWGSPHPISIKYNKQLRTNIVNVIPYQECAARFKGTKVKVAKSLICAGGGVPYAGPGAPGIVNGRLCAMAVDKKIENYPHLYIDLNNGRILSFLNGFISNR